MDKPDFLSAGQIVDWHHPAVAAQAERLASGVTDKVELARRCFVFVRDEIAHSFDIRATAVTCCASQVLQAGHGICYAKSHLLAALLRANGIAAGFAYQRLSDDDGGFCLHGFNTVLLPAFGWFRCDARGNKPGVAARFEPPHEALAFSHDGPGECDYRLNLAQPWPSVVRALQSSATVAQLSRSLPSRIHMG
jgi:transglutaminase-like putative cysteine protease